MLDLSLLSRRPIVTGMAMAVVTAGALAGVELTIAQELQFVLDKSPLQAGFFMLPIMVAATVGGPIAGFLSNRFGLRLVASLSILLAAISLAALAQFDFHQQGKIIAAFLALLGLSLSIGLTASSIAIMGAVETEKGGSAGALEAMGYELGAGLGITMFGVALSAIYASAMVMPAGVTPELADAARLSIGDTYMVAEHLSGDVGQPLILAGKKAFSTAHATLLTSAASLLGILAVAVFFALKDSRR